ncbi:DEAD/DEAH box helicase [Tabrizicola sp. YIM 78059]|uniref:DEAD/DEAH box helicase n=1 Tax=Tabrizicola sp. YIM 78059 TaxID=2529861 RepID=UPI0010AABDC8|nr:DEAD/DEAH box helicase [Tabrizicola sp. YIM 78059]
MTDHAASNLLPALARQTRSSAMGMTARARLASPGLNQWLARELAKDPGTAGALIADPVIEIARAWKPADCPLSALAPGLLSPDLVAALDGTATSRMPADRPPYAHQLAAWQATLGQGKSALITAGTGAGKTECFLIPVLQDALAHPRPGGGVRAILLYPLNALIESQRDRLRAWVEGLGGRVRFALLNGDTPETERQATIRSDMVELRSRQAIRERPPEILVTNITMLEYLLLRSTDRPILQASQGALRWVVLDEAHTYAGSQAAEMALLLRRVRAAFGVTPGDVRLIATSATIGGEERTAEKLAAFAAALAGQGQDQVAVIEGQERIPDLPPAAPDGPLLPDAAPEVLAAHPRVQALRRALSDAGRPLGEVARILTGEPGQREAAARLLDRLGTAEWQGRPLMPWRAHLFHRAQGGLWACADPACPHRAPELAADGAGWPFGALRLSPRATCACGAQVYEVVACNECGSVHLQGQALRGAQLRLLPPEPGEGDDFALDQDPDDEATPAAPVGVAWLAAPGQGGGLPGWLGADGLWFDNAPPTGTRAVAARLLQTADERACCARAGQAGLTGFRFGPAFLMGNGLAGLLDDLAPPDGRPGLPAGGRRAISFSDSRQGVARLAAKLQQGAERDLTRAFLWHAVQEDRGGADPSEIGKLREKIARMEAAGLGDLADEDRKRLAELTGATAAPIPWGELVQGLASHEDLRSFAGEIWKGRSLGAGLADDPAKLAEMFLYQELFRRPRVQNNPETLGLLRLTFPAMEERARLSGPPAPLREAGIDAEGWAGLAQAAVDLVFRQNLAVDMTPAFVRLVAPRYGVLNAVMPAGTRSEDMPANSRRWPGVRAVNGRLPRLTELVYTLTGGSPDSRIDQDRAGEVLDALWQLIAGTAARDTGAGAWRLDFGRAAVARLDRAFLCPVTRRPHAYSLSGRSPNDPARTMQPVTLPRLPMANRGGLTRDQAAGVAQWCQTDPGVAAMRARGLWTDLHDRLAAFPPYIRAQEHSAQIPRPTLQRYEQAFAEGRINLLNCSTTMEMGVDLADVRLVVNANVPPSLASYRQRAGRAGRRGEPFAFTMTFCRDLPLDRRAFDNPAAWLGRPIVAPRVWFDSPALVRRHVNAAILTAWLAARGGTDVTGSIGAFLGAGQDADNPVVAGAPADAFLADLDAGWVEGLDGPLRDLLAGTVLAGQGAGALGAQTRAAFEALVAGWRREHLTLLQAAAAAPDREARQAQELRAKRLAGEFLLGELARRGFTPAYGFPTDVVTFQNLRHRSADAGQGESRFVRGTASRALDQALREYAPGAELVIDGLVHRASGILPAWEAGADASGLEDLRSLWSCPACRAFDWAPTAPDSCPRCGQAPLDIRRCLRPAGFLGDEPAHVGYENLSHVTADPPRLSAHGGDWVALAEGAGRMRADPEGRLAVTTAGPQGGGFAVCLDCGRAHPMETPPPGLPAVLPDAMRKHHALLLRRGLSRTRDGYCPASDNPARIQRNLHLAQVTRTDVWEWQLPATCGEITVTEPAARALAAALREALAERLGVEPAEIVPSAASSVGPTGEAGLSAFLHDRAAGGAGLSARMAEPEMLAAGVTRAAELLDCPEACRRGCPACILRPDLNSRDLVLDRAGALSLALALRDRLALPPELLVFGPATQLAGRPAAALIADRLRRGQLRGLDLWLHGDPGGWDLSGWPLRRLLPRLEEAGIRPRVGILASALTSAGLTLPVKLALHALARTADLHRAEALPQAGGAMVLCHLHGPSDGQALAVTTQAEAAPGPGWGQGAAAPALIGPATAPAMGNRLSADRLIELGMGNARLLWHEAALDGPAKGFGRRFWDWLAREAPLEVGAMRSAGVARLHYSDRYLLQAYLLRLLAELMQAAPGAQGAALAVDLARDERPPPDPRLMHHNFPGDALRREVLRHLLPGASIELRAKADMPHFRRLSVWLKDGRRLDILLDQGLGAWSAAGSQRHDFSASAAAQARALSSTAFEVQAGRAATPIALQMHQATS